MGDDAARKRFEEIRAKAETGDIEAQYDLGELYENLKGDAALLEANKWFRKAAERGHSGAQNKLGEMALRRGTKFYPKIAILWYDSRGIDAHFITRLSRSR